MAQITSDTTAKLLSVDVAATAASATASGHEDEDRHEDDEEYKKMEIQSDVLRIFELMVRISFLLFFFFTFFLLSNFLLIFLFFLFDSFLILPSLLCLLLILLFYHVFYLISFLISSSCPFFFTPLSFFLFPLSLSLPPSLPSTLYVSYLFIFHHFSQVQRRLIVSVPPLDLKRRLMERSEKNALTLGRVNNAAASNSSSLGAGR